MVNTKQGNKMDFKKIMLAVAESQADQFKDKAVAWVQSEEFQDELASKINDKIDIPFVSEEKEQIFFEKCVDLVADIVEGLFRGK
tara:strand:+ start:657 stop:911 length:255 start_codon:yes stop_codon:yes gene_type:complete